MTTTLKNQAHHPKSSVDVSYDVVIVGGGAAGISTAASLLSRQSNLNIAILDPADVHYYQPGWTMVGGGIFPPNPPFAPCHL
jgi:sulfide:quinone oxidoreductase